MIKNLACKNKLKTLDSDNICKIHHVQRKGQEVRKGNLLIGINLLQACLGVPVDF